ncbi:puromycin-sensitive aminopeptidase-like isoform X2 [Frankliniella occidentalis]|nr:puromycin-sensitive aminopeptidase-like isoform X2 [Frankliniella occidentalis]
MRGFYRCKYKSHDTEEERFCAISKFDAGQAHRCFPCWDEPAIKATFDITLRIPTNRVALSNMPVSHEEEMTDSTKAVRFETTPIMSAHLVAIVVAELDFIEETVDGIPIRVYTPLGKKEQGRFALEAAVRVLPFYKEHFELPYPLPKLDFVAIENFSPGTVGNWGCIIYRDLGLLRGDKLKPPKRTVALLVAHGLVYQWIGGLTTMEWWTHFWLKEGYAAFLQYLCTAHLYPEFDLWTQFISDTYCHARTMDGVRSVIPLEVTIGHPIEVQDVFDDISCSKAASVIRMLHRYIGDANFTKGMSLYLHNFEYGNATTDDLWECLEEVSNKPVLEIMRTWTRQSGYPVVSVKCEIEGDTHKLYLEQAPFKGIGLGPDSDDRLWPIPIQFSAAADPQHVIHEYMLRSKEAIVLLEHVKPTDWVMLNPGVFGFYRVNYSSEMLEMLKPGVADLSIPAIDRLTLLDDYFSLAKAGLCSTGQVLRLLHAMKNETSCCVWVEMCNILVRLRVLLQHSDDVYPLFMDFGKRLLQPISQSIRLWNPAADEKYEDRVLRCLILDQLNAFDDQATYEESKKRFNSHVTGSIRLHHDIQSSVYCGVLAKADTATYETFLKMYHEATSQEEKDRIAISLATIDDTELLREVMKFLFSDEVNPQILLRVFGVMTHIKRGREVMWEFSKENWNKLYSKYGSFALFSHYLVTAFQNFATQEIVEELEEFFTNNETSGAEKAVQQVLCYIRMNTAWLKRDLVDIKSVLESFL